MLLLPRDGCASHAARLAAPSEPSIGALARQYFPKSRQRRYGFWKIFPNGEGMSQSPQRTLDRTDRRILEALQSDARLTLAELADRVALSPSPCWRRVQMLEQSGFITGYHARLDRRRIGLDVHGFVWLRMQNHTPRTAALFERQVVALPEVVSCQNLSGQHDYQLELVAADHDAFALLVREKIRALPGVKDILTSVTLREIKSAAGLPLQV